MPKVLLCATTTGYQLASFREAAALLGYETVLATDRCHVLDDPWGDRAIPFERGEIPDGLDGVVALGEKAAEFAAGLGMRFHSPDAVRAAADKRLTRQRFREAGMLSPGNVRFPLVVKPASRSASQGVIRADSPPELEAAIQRVRKLIGTEAMLIEEFIPGHEYALEGLVSGGVLHPVAMFDKPDPLDGPFFEETIYVVIPPIAATVAAAQEAVSALRLSDGPVHAEMRINDGGVWMLEVAPRPVGGLCAKAVPGLESAILRHAVTGETPDVFAGPSAVMMIPVGAGGVFRGVAGVEEASEWAEVVITAKEGQHFRPWPEGNSYPGFLFGKSAEAVRRAHACLRFDYSFSFLP